MLVAEKEYGHYEYGQYHVEERQKKNRLNNRNRRIKAKKRNKAANRLAIISLAMVCLFLALFILYRYANITKIRTEITELEKQRIQLEKDKEFLVAELEGIKSSSRIEEKAMIILGMDYPTEEQVVYVNLEEDLAEEQELKEELSLFGQFKNIVNLVLNLF